MKKYIITIIVITIITMIIISSNCESSEKYTDENDAKVQNQKLITDKELYLGLNVQNDDYFLDSNTKVYKYITSAIEYAKEQINDASHVGDYEKYSDENLKQEQAFFISNFTDYLRDNIDNIDLDLKQQIGATSQNVVDTYLSNYPPHDKYEFVFLVNSSIVDIKTKIYSAYKNE